MTPDKLILGPTAPEPPEAYRFEEGRLLPWDPGIPTPEIKALVQGRYRPFIYDGRDGWSISFFRVAHPDKPYAGYRYLAQLAGTDWSAFFFCRDLTEVMDLRRLTAPLP